MTSLISRGLRFENNRLFILDQQKLPGKEEWLESDSPESMAGIIRELKVRGAPLIGIAASLSLALCARKGAGKKEMRKAARQLRESRPTAVNLMAALDRMLDVLNADGSLMEKAREIFYEDRELCENMAIHGASLVEDGDSILTHCNTGGIATAGIGTALGVITKAHRQGKRVRVYVDETRPLLQGGRLTAWELGSIGVPYTLICDNMAASLMAKGKIRKVFVGADRIAINGDFANKTGTYSVAVSARYHKIPFYPVAPYTTIDFSCRSGEDIPIEERKPGEVRGASGSFGSVCWSPGDCEVYNPAFDVTPVELVTSLISDRGVFSKEQLKNGCLTRLQKAP